MARSGGESKQGLIITLIFFILATIILGVTTYLGFAGQEELRKKAEDADRKSKDWEARYEWQQFSAVTYRAYCGHMLAKDSDTIEALRTKFESGKFGNVQDPARDDSIKVIRENLDGQLGWLPAEKKPKETYLGRLTQAKQELEAVKKNWDTEKGNVKKLTDEVAGKDEDAKKARAEYDKNIKAAEAKVATARKEVEDLIATLQKQVEDLGKERDDVKTEIAKVKEETGKTVGSLSKKLTDQKFKLEKAEAATQARTAAAINLNEPHGKIISFDPTGEKPFINLGEADSVKTGLTFSVYGVGPDGKALKTAKANIEVIRVINEHLSQVQVTDYKVDKYRDPILRNDLLFNPGWSPNLKKHIAIAGIIDLLGDGQDNIQEFMRNLERQGVVVDGWLDRKDMTFKGKGMNRQTEYLVLGNIPDTGEGLKEDDPRAKKRNDLMDAMTKAQQKAIDNGVTIITLRNFLVLTGYPLPRVAPTGPALHPSVSAAGSPLDKKFDKGPGLDKPGAGMEGKDK